MAGNLTITARLLPDSVVFTVRGRDAWALSELAAAGESGATPIDVPGPRRSVYVFSLKHEHRLSIGTVNEPRGGGMNAGIIIDEWRKNRRERLRVRLDCYLAQPVVCCRAWYPTSSGPWPDATGLRMVIPIPTCTGLRLDRWRGVERLGVR